MFGVVEVQLVCEVELDVGGPNNPANALGKSVCVHGRVATSLVMSFFSSAEMRASKEIQKDLLRLIVTLETRDVNKLVASLGPELSCFDLLALATSCCSLGYPLIFR